MAVVDMLSKLAANLVKTKEGGRERREEWRKGEGREGGEG